MAKLKRLLACLVLIGATVGATLFVTPGTAFAIDILGNACKQGSGPACQGGSDNPFIGSGGVLTKVTNILAIVAGVMGVIMIIIGGFKYITSDGDSGKAASGKNTVIYGLIGLIIVVLAREIIGLVLTRLS